MTDHLSFDASLGTRAPAAPAAGGPRTRRAPAGRRSPDDDARLAGTCICTDYLKVLLQAALDGRHRVPAGRGRRHRLHVHRDADLRGADPAADRGRESERRQLQGGARRGPGARPTTTRRSTTSCRAGRWRGEHSTQLKLWDTRAVRRRRLTRASASRRAILGSARRLVIGLFKSEADSRTTNQARRRRRDRRAVARDRRASSVA